MIQSSTAKSSARSRARSQSADAQTTPDSSKSLSTKAKSPAQIQAQSRGSKKAKKVKIGLSLTPEAASLLDQAVKAAGLSRSALIEKLALENQINIVELGAESLSEAAPASAAPINKDKKIESPQASAQPPLAAIADLQRTISTQQATIESLEQQLANPPSAPSAADSHRESELHQTINFLQAQLNHYRQQAIAQAQQRHQLQDSFEQQAMQIVSLQQQIVQLQQTATIGEAHLNRWRQRYFSR